MSLHFTIDPNRCIQCDACITDCPARIITRQDTSPCPVILPESEEGCLRCQHCLALCPTAAVSIFGRNPDDSVLLTPDAVPTLEQMENLTRGRRSVRQFREENVPRETIDRLLTTLANVPTGCNDQDLTFTVVDDRAELTRLLERMIGILEAKIASGAEVSDFLGAFIAVYRDHGVDAFFRGAPHLLIVSAGENAHTPEPDVLLAVTYFELLAHCAGLGATWCGMLKMATDAAPELRPLFGLGPDTPFYAVMFGIPAIHFARTVQRDDAAIIRRLPTG